MGLREKYGKKFEMRGFEPIDLNEANVEVIFKRCLADENTTEKEGTFLFSRVFGYSEKEEDWIYFDKNKIKESKKSILFLYGQLYAWHHIPQSVTLTPKSVSEKYTGEQWTKNSGILSEFLYLGRSINTVTPFIKESGCVMFIHFRDTLSPNDPNFPEWWAKHKPEWER